MCAQVIPIKRLSSQSCAHAAGRTGPDGNPSIVARTLGCNLGSHFVAFFALTPTNPEKAEHDEIRIHKREFELGRIGRGVSRLLSCGSGVSPKLHAEATTPRLKHCLRQLITKLEGLARDVQTESGFSCKKPSAPMTDMAVSSRRNRTRTSGAVKAVTLANDEFLGLLELALNEVSHRFRDEWSNCDQRRSS
jgi:hypothetical protein